MLRVVFVDRSVVRVNCAHVQVCALVPFVCKSAGTSASGDVRRLRNKDDSEQRPAPANLVCVLRLNNVSVCRRDARNASRGQQIKQRTPTTKQRSTYDGVRNDNDDDDNDTNVVRVADPGPAQSPMPVSN